MGQEADRINRMDRIKEKAASNLDLPSLLNTVNPVNPVSLLSSLV
jgi:hypothetical protein